MNIEHQNAKIEWLLRSIVIQLNPDDRLRLFEALKVQFCMGCGLTAAEGGGRECQCQNDE